MTREKRIQILNCKSSREAIKYHFEYSKTRDSRWLVIDCIEENKGFPLTFKKSGEDQKIAKQIVDLWFEEFFGGCR